MGLLTLIVVLPLLGFVLNGLLGNRLGKGFVSAVGCGLPAIAFAAAIKCFLDLKGDVVPQLLLGQRGLSILRLAIRNLSSHAPTPEKWNIQHKSGCGRRRCVPIETELIRLRGP